MGTYIAPGTPMQNGFVESFNGRMAASADSLRRCSALRADPESKRTGRCARSGASRPAPSHHQPPEQKRNRLNLPAYKKQDAGHSKRIVGRPAKLRGSFGTAPRSAGPPAPCAQRHGRAARSP
ncbi:integrase core domain-containing protein [Reyranella sp.]|uniref:integrase core domain-containing protein n=1 Tax=Reyranella sp. TaxID=1929291 RepID=UPI0040360F32